MNVNNLAGYLIVQNYCFFAPRLLTFSFKVVDILRQPSEKHDFGLNNDGFSVKKNKKLG